MAQGVRLHVSGDRALFTRAELKAERLSYDVMTPSAARGIVGSLHWKPAIRWIIDAIHVLKPIRFQSIRRNEVGSKLSVASAHKAMRSGNVGDLFLAVDEVDPKTGKPKHRQQRAATVLVDVAYVIEAHFEMTDRAGAEDNPGKHLDMFNRRARKGQCFYQPCLGAREFAARFRLIEPDELIPSAGNANKDRDLGLMLYDIDHANGRESMFFRARLENGVMRVPPPDSPEIYR